MVERLKGAHPRAVARMLMSERETDENVRDSITREEAQERLRKRRRRMNLGPWDVCEAVSDLASDSDRPREHQEELSVSMDEAASLVQSLITTMVIETSSSEVEATRGLRRMCDPALGDEALDGYLHHYTRCDDRVQLTRLRTSVRRFFASRLSERSSGDRRGLPSTVSSLTALLSAAEGLVPEPDSDDGDAETVAAGCCGRARSRLEGRRRASDSKRPREALCRLQPGPGGEGDDGRPDTVRKTLVFSGGDDDEDDGDDARRGSFAPGPSDGPSRTGAATKGCFDGTSTWSLSDHMRRKTYAPDETLKRDYHLGPNNEL